MDEKLVLEVLSFLLERTARPESCYDGRNGDLLKKVKDEIVDMKFREDFEDSH